MGFVSILGMAHKLIEARVGPGDIAIDATVGGGHDTLALARLVGAGGRVYGFDIQPQAIERTWLRLEAAGVGGERVTLFAASHDRMAASVPAEAHGRIAAVMFNLGYLPGADHATITVPATTLPALDASLALLRPGGILTVVAYPGHEGGHAEAAAVERWAAELPQDECQSLLYRFVNQRNDPPFLLAVEKR